MRALLRGAVLAGVLSAAGVLGACRLGAPPADGDEGALLRVPSHWPAVPVPAHNPVTVEKAELGRRLFFDPILSGDRTVSCASCHLPSRAFSDPRPLSTGVRGGTTLRNAPSLFAVAYEPLLHRDGGVLFLEAQVLVPLEDENEMDADVDEVLERLARHPEYPALFREAFGEGPSLRTLTQALATFQRTLLPTDSPYDRFLRGDEQALSAEARRGHDLFFGRAGCATCHAGVRLTDGSFRDNGHPHRPFDTGRAEVTGRPEDVGRFRVPSLRNVAVTAPYMHDGTLPTLEAVVAHYDRGGAGTPNQDPAVRPLRLTAAERAALVAFLEALTDDAFRSP